MKNLYFFGGSFFKMKIAEVLNFQWIKYLGKGLSYLKNWGIGIYCCRNYGPSKFWRPLSKEMSAKSLKFFGPPTTKWRPCKIFAKLNGNHLLMANIFKLHKYQTFGLIKIHNMSKIWFANNKFNFLRWNKKTFFQEFSRAFSCQKLSQTWDFVFNNTGY